MYVVTYCMELCDQVDGLGDLVYGVTRLDGYQVTYCMGLGDQVDGLGNLVDGVRRLDGCMRLLIVWDYATRWIGEEIQHDGQATRQMDQEI